MSYQVLYRRYRPKTFSDIVGQEHITRILQNQIISGNISHAYLFSGSKGTGKTSTAKVFARALNCLNPQGGEPCGVCAHCVLSAESMTDIIEIDGASNRGIDEIRQLREKVNYMPAVGAYRVYIIDEVHMLTTEAFNALLKTLEEPPSHVVFIFATTEVNRLLPTILSRCQRFDFVRIPTELIIGRLAEVMADIHVSAEAEALSLIAQNADGALRDALSLADKAISMGSGEALTALDVQAALGLLDSSLIFAIAEAVMAEDIGDAFKRVDNALRSGSDSLTITNQLIDYFRCLMIYSSTPDAAAILQKPESYLSNLQKNARALSRAEQIKYITELSRLRSDAKYQRDPRAMLEVTLLKLCERDMLAEESSLRTQVELLTAQVSSMAQAIKNLRAGISAAPSAAAGKTEKEPAPIPTAPASPATAAEKPKPKAGPMADAAVIPAAADCEADRTRLRELQEAFNFCANNVMNNSRNIIFQNIFQNMKVYGYRGGTIYVYLTNQAKTLFSSYRQRGGAQILSELLSDKLGYACEVVVTEAPKAKERRAAESPKAESAPKVKSAPKAESAPQAESTLSQSIEDIFGEVTELEE